MRYGILVVAVIITIGLVVVFNPFESVAYGTTCFKEICFNVSLATTPIQQSRGLMSVERLDADSGMLFVFESDGVYPFWMKDVLIPLDMIWMDSGGKVVFIASEVQPCSLSCPSIYPGIDARYVLEINGGLTMSMGLEVGDRMIISF
ncbi:MAG: DUF192 domain-containing protein [Candidatus Aenigmatarchaeota archaeon]